MGRKDKIEQVEVIETEVATPVATETGRKKYTPEQVAVIKARRDEKNAAVKTIIAIIIAGGVDSEISQELFDLAKLAQPKNGGGNGGGSKKASVLSSVKALFVDKDVIDETAIFTELKLGRSDMNKNIKLMIKNYKPENRTWVKFNSEDGEYIVEGRGATAPEGWTGYLPVEEVITEDEAPVADDTEE